MIYKHLNSWYVDMRCCVRSTSFSFSSFLFFPSSNSFLFRSSLVPCPSSSIYPSLIVSSIVITDHLVRWSSSIHPTHLLSALHLYLRTKEVGGGHTKLWYCCPCPCPCPWVCPWVCSTIPNPPKLGCCSNVVTDWPNWEVRRAPAPDGGGAWWVYGESIDGDANCYQLLSYSFGPSL